MNSCLDKLFTTYEVSWRWSHEVEKSMWVVIDEACPFQQYATSDAVRLHFYREYNYEYNCFFFFLLFVIGFI